MFKNLYLAAKKSIRKISSDIIPSKTEGVGEMAEMEITCPKCRNRITMHYALSSMRVGGSKLFAIRGILKCGECGHQRPIALEGQSISEIMEQLPGQQSEKLTTKVPADIKDDLKEAEAAYFNQCLQGQCRHVPKGCTVILD